MEGRDGYNRRVLIDTHTHLLRLSVPPEIAVREAREVGVEAVVNIGTNVSDSREGVELARRTAGVFTTGGIHPHNAGDHSQESLAALLELAGSGEIVALGEVGLDYYRNEWPPEMQRALFQDVVSIANEVRLPLVIHSREAFSDTMDVLAGARVPVVLHCFEGGESEVLEAAERGYYIGLTGNVTYKNKPTAEFLDGIPPERILVETDAPYLSPEPLRGKPNVPKNVVHTARFVAGRLGMDEAGFAALTTANARRFYGLDGEPGSAGPVA
ncbi:TIGR00010: hydrolase, TatD family [Rubrobacter radiotolerans]|uniref:TIGR00010: hydrolase, TatD family n=1 Tax=Rubrobacter radiotolerans TaxID=42256 RepID=A0A023X1M2_RUBRA|nr:TatD family hydrolase [Rubrobacter radiotolerans]AHY46066.1 TIGR00010: hydrolase, TatD family [Rubrobacter radiotolerans]MDX5893476.1 TatD family hydrolase [Rubrobacter radiotolerans]SMC03804.1 TatD DNase family protein [Rubrobacter radiotolerans DSM 5868]